MKWIQSIIVGCLFAAPFIVEIAKELTK